MTDKKQSQSKQSSASESKKNSTDILEKLSSLSGVLEGDVSSVEPDAAFKVIEEWSGIIKKTKGADSKEVASGLKELQELLKGEDSGHELGELLGHLGTQTSKMAADADQGLKNPLKILGKQLSKVGMSLVREDDRHQLEEIHSLVEDLDQDVEEIDAKSSMGDLDKWSEMLQKSDDKDIKTIAKDLKKLKDALKGGKLKGSDISEMLVQLGEQTSEASAVANRGFKGAIQTLGKSLTKLGKSIE